MTISALPTAPQRTDPPDTFATRADAWVAALSTWTTQVNALAVEVDTDATTATTQAGIATTQAGLSATYASNSSASASQAAASAQTAINAPGTTATSTSSLTIGIGSKTLTIQTGKTIVVGMYLLIADTQTPSNYMIGQVTSYNNSNGSLTIVSESTSGSGTFTSWTISLTAKPSGAAIATEAEMKAGTETTIRSLSPKLVADAINIRVKKPHYITYSQTWTVPDNIKEVFVQLVGGGADGAGITNSTGVAIGGGAGGYSEKLITVTPGSSINITIGAYGTTGGTTSFGSHCSATGGSGSAAGYGISGDLNTYGSDGFCLADRDGSNYIAAISIGGSSYFGLGGVGSGSNSFGAIPAYSNAYGAGGAGAFAKTQSTLSGGQGRSGVVIIWY